MQPAEEDRVPLPKVAAAISKCNDPEIVIEIDFIVRIGASNQGAAQMFDLDAMRVDKFIEAWTQGHGMLSIAPCNQPLASRRSIAIAAIAETRIFLAYG